MTGNAARVKRLRVLAGLTLDHSMELVSRSTSPLVKKKSTIPSEDMVSSSVEYHVSNHKLAPKGPLNADLKTWQPSETASSNNGLSVKNLDIPSSQIAKKARQHLALRGSAKTSQAIR